MISGLLFPSGVLRRTYPMVGWWARMRTMTTRKSAALACRCPARLSLYLLVLPLDAGIGQAPQSLAKVVIESFGEVLAAFFTGRRDVYTNDRSGLASTRAGLGPRANEYAILHGTVRREPLGPLVRKDDWRRSTS